MRFFLLFPSSSMIDRKAPWLKRAFLGVTILYWLLNLLFAHAVYTSFDRYQQLTRILSKIKVDQLIGFFLLMMSLIGLASLILNTVRAGSKDERRRMVILLVGTLVGLLPLVIFIIYITVFGSGEPSLWWLALVGLTLGTFPLSFVYAVVKHRVFGIRVILRRGLQYALVSRGFLAVEGALIFAVFFFATGPLFVALFPQAGTSAIAITMAVITLGLVLGLREVNRHVMPIIDRHFFREAYNTQQILTDLSRTVPRVAAEPDKLLGMIAGKISDALHPDRLSVFLRGAPIKSSLTGTDPSTHTSLTLSLKQTANYQCCGLWVRSDDHDHMLSPTDLIGDMSLTADAFIARHLEGVAAEEPAALEVYLDDPKSWASALARVDSLTDARYLEKALIERTNTKLIIPLVSNDRVRGFMSLGEKLSQEPYSKDDKELLLTVGEKTAFALDYAQLITQVADQEKLKREIEIAQEVQAQLFPQALPPMKTLEYTGICLPARAVGGDYYDFLLLESDKLGIAVGDITGKGISAALLMASLQALLRSHAPSRGAAVDELVSDINRLLVGSTDSSKYATFFYGLYDDRHRTLSYVNAGHNPPLLFRPRTAMGGSLPFDSEPDGGSFMSQDIRSCETMRLETGGMVLGLFPDVTYQHETVQMRPGDTLVIYSDGISEAMNRHREEFGEARLISLMTAKTHLSALQLRDLILHEITRFVRDAPQHDDMTLVLAKVV